MRSTVVEKSELQNSYFDCENLRDVIAMVETKLQGQGEVVCQFVLNGMTLREEDETKFAEIKLEEIEYLEIKSEKPTALLFQILKNWENEIPRIVTKTDGLAGQIRGQGIEGHYTAFVNLIDSCQFLVESLVSVESVMDTQGFWSAQQWKQNEAQMGKAIVQALDSFERRDFAALTDVLEYDLANSLQSWFDLLKGLNLRLQEENERDSRGLTERIFKNSDRHTGEDSVDSEAPSADRD